MDECTRIDRLFEGIGIFRSLYLAKAACTASVWTSAQRNSSGRCFTTMVTIVFIFLTPSRRKWSAFPLGPALQLLSRCCFLEDSTFELDKYFQL